MLLPDEPTKDELAAWTPGAPIDRRVDATLLDTATGAATEVVVSITRGEVLAHRARAERRTPVRPAAVPVRGVRPRRGRSSRPPPSGGPRCRRGLEDHMELAFCCPLAPGYTGRADEVGRRVIRSLTFLKYDEDDSPWAHPVEGLIVHIDLTDEQRDPHRGRGRRAGSRRPAATTTPRCRARPATTLKPIEITQPEGPSFHVTGSLVEWEKLVDARRLQRPRRSRAARRHVRRALGAQPRERARDGRPLRRHRPRPLLDQLLRRGRVPARQEREPPRARLRLPGRDPLPRRLRRRRSRSPRAHPERGLHARGGLRHPLEAHRARPVAPTCAARAGFVVSYFSTIGNYDYGFYWYFSLDGSIEVVAKATGIVFAGAGGPGVARGTRPSSPPGSSPRCTSTCSARDSTSRSTARTTAWSRSTRSACRWARTTRSATRSRWSETPLAHRDARRSARRTPRSPASGRCRAPHARTTSDAPPRTT